MQSKKRRHKRKKQLKINGQLKRRLFGHLSITPCHYCKIVFFVEELTVEHLIPLSFGGTNDDNNIALACASCNQAKGKEAWILKKQILKERYEQHSAKHCR